MEEKIITSIIAIAMIVVAVVATIITLSWGGVETAIIMAVIALMVEAVFSINEALKAEDRSALYIWGACAFHMVIFFIIWSTTSALGWWGEDFVWSCERGHGIFTDETSPAYLWYVLLGMAAARLLILQPIYLLILKKHR